MRPLKLNIQAFGPYKEKEEIDFTELEDVNLFVISGKTGSGKTTLFDAISFALYGSASGEDREDIYLLRSQFAHDDLSTCVEFVFELKGKKYRVLRQLGHQKLGNKTKTGEKYEFYEQVDEEKEEPAVDRQIVSEINAKIEELIGLSQEQFKQIVMLPQGEFRKFLTSDTENKESILRRLFKTEKYDQIVARLKDKRDILKKDYELHEVKLNHIIASLKNSLPVEEQATELTALFEKEHYNSSQVIEAAKKEVESLTEVEAIEIKKLAQDEADYQKAYNHLVASKTTNKLFEEQAQLMGNLLNLDQKEEEMNKLKENLEASEAALRISHYEESYLKLEQALKKKELKIEELKISLAKKDASHAQLKEENKKLVKLEVTIEQDKKQLELLKRYKKQLGDIRQLNGIIKHQQSEFETVKCQLGNLTEGKSATEREIKNLTETIEDFINETRNLPQKESERERLRLDYKKVEKYVRLSEELERNKKTLREVKEKLVKLKHKYHSEEAKWYEEQAALLAIKLEAGEPCLVCGSTEHPKKAKQSNYVLTREELNQLEGKVNEFELEKQTYKYEIQEKLRQISELEEEYQTDYFLQPKERLREIKERGLKLKEVIQSLEEKNKLITAFTEQRKRLREKLEIDRVSEEEMRKESEEKMKEYNRLLTERDVLVKQVPEVYQEPSKVESELKELEGKIISYHTRKEKAKQEFDQVNKEITMLKTQEAETRKSIDQLIKDVHSEKTNFELKLKEANFDAQKDYLMAKKSRTEVIHMKEQLDSYEKDRLEVETHLKHLKNQLSGKEKVDLNKLEQMVEKINLKREKQIELTHDLRQRKRELNQSVTQIKQINQEIEAEETELLILEDLYNMTRGHNESRISFERYLQIEYLEEIIQSANLRLYDLSNGQYQLIRSERKESHGRQSGLALDINDSYTGQTRDVKSLSGGEKFNTSLALALGMSDVIQSFEGNVSIDMMFIDEGFGSLDQESLTKAIDTLIDLQKTGRLIGVISHVEELKAIFPAVLHVEKNRQGNSRTYFKLN